MKIKLNNREEEFAGDKLSVEEIIAVKSYVFKMLVVRLNDHLVKKICIHQHLLKMVMI